jgi:hypothetical protein
MPRRLLPLIGYVSEVAATGSSAEAVINPNTVLKACRNSNTSFVAARLARASYAEPGALTAELTLLGRQNSPRGAR